eukprot:CAMPEP_0203912388 /NCGR_PEP_ID=MMETSP0359-20131031/53474_1 /ASSEMBLY_ACC=CAM_ASM_000338 /TAXON_ID=268821 /ORGANISM="Scrippsiella Hangoei, Strain SHTV-5" /LENGTH=63 /DNA_ID=CAMNT_0050838317 /DNA_START=47 /DNA_END=234 /DNA_ORIENTATION=+
MAKTRIGQSCKGSRVGGLVQQLRETGAAAALETLVLDSNPQLGDGLGPALSEAPWANTESKLR